MIRVKMRFFSIFKDIIGKDELEFEFEESITIEEILNGLSKKYPYLRKALEKYPTIILVDGEPSDPKNRIEKDTEIAIIPPPSGGTIDKHIHVALFESDEDLDVNRRINELSSKYSEMGAGAIAIFIGFVKGEVNGVKVHELVYEPYEPYTLKKLEKIAQEEVDKDDVMAIEILHRVGSAKPGEKTLYISCLLYTSPSPRDRG